MLKILLKKQLKEVNARFFISGKTGERRKKSGTIGIIALFSFAFLLIMGAVFIFAMGISMSVAGTDLTWIPFTIFGSAAIVLGVFGSVFSTYSSLYLSKDNELLISMPIPPVYIIIARMSGVYLMGLLYSSIIFIPALIAYYIMGKPTPASVIGSILLYLCCSVIILVISCALGFVVAMLSSKLKSKGFITTTLAVLFFLVYYFFCFNMGNVMEAILDNTVEVGANIKNAAYILYLLGTAGAGDVLSIVGLVVFSAIALFITCFVISKTFIGIATMKKTPKRVEVTEIKAEDIKSLGIAKNLFKREIKHFLSSSTYMINTGIGSFFLIAVGILELIFTKDIAQTLTELGISLSVLPVMGGAVVGIIASLNVITAPSISLEGEQIWILQSLPIEPIRIFDAKQYLHWIFTMPPAVFAVICHGISFRLDLVDTLMMIIYIIIVIMLNSAFGLFINLKRPNLHWTSEAVPVKQSLAVMIGMVLGIVVNILFILFGILFAFIGSDMVTYMVISIILIVLFTRVINRWLRNQGSEIFGSLN